MSPADLTREEIKTIIIAWKSIVDAFPELSDEIAVMERAYIDTFDDAIPKPPTTITDSIAAVLSAGRIDKVHLIR